MRMSQMRTASNVDMARMPDMESDGGLPEVVPISADMMANVIVRP